MLRPNNQIPKKLLNCKTYKTMRVRVTFTDPFMNPGWRSWRNPVDPVPRYIRIGALVDGGCGYIDRWRPGQIIRVQILEPLI